MKIIELLNAQNAFDLNCKFDGDMQLAFKVVKFVKDSETETNFYKQKYSEIVNKYALKNKQGEIDNKDGIKIPPELITNFNKEISDLDNVNVKTPDIVFTMEELQKCELTGVGVYALYPFIKE